MGDKVRIVRGDATLETTAARVVVRADVEGAARVEPEDGEVPVVPDGLACEFTWDLGRGRWWLERISVSGWEVGGASRGVVSFRGEPDSVGELRQVPEWVTATARLFAPTVDLVVREPGVRAPSVVPVHVEHGERTVDGVLLRSVVCAHTIVHGVTGLVVAGAPVMETGHGSGPQRPERLSLRWGWGHVDHGGVWAVVEQHLFGPDRRVFDPAVWLYPHVDGLAPLHIGFGPGTGQSTAG